MQPKFFSHPSIREPGVWPRWLAIFSLTLFGALFVSLQMGIAADWVTFPGKDGPGKGTHVVFVTGDDEYFSEEGMPLIAHILASKHGFTCTVLFAINKKTGVIDPNTRDNIPGLEQLEKANLMVIFTRFRDLPDAQLKFIADYAESGRPILGLRTATHAFNFSKPNESELKRKYHWQGREVGFEGGFGRRILGETWVSHWGHHGGESTRGIVAPDALQHPIVRGIKDGDIWGTTDVYEVRLPLSGDSQPIIMGQVVAGMKPTDPPASSKNRGKNKNQPMMPVAWTRTFTGTNGKPARVFTTTMGGKMSGHADWDNEGLRRLLVNATYWCVGLELAIPETAKSADVAPAWQENPFRRGVTPASAADSIRLVTP